MAPMLEDEIMHDAEKMNSKVAGIARTGKQIYDFIEQLKRAKNAAPENLDNGLPFSFSGQITDLSYFNTNDILPKEVIDSIPDAELKEAVISNLELAEKQGLIDVDLNNGNITLTDSGREYINNPNFIRAANIDKARSAIRAMEIQHGLENDTIRYGILLRVQIEICNSSDLRLTSTLKKSRCRPIRKRLCKLWKISLNGKKTGLCSTILTTQAYHLQSSVRKSYTVIWQTVLI